MRRHLAAFRVTACCAALFSTCCVHGQGVLTIKSPIERQVSQRNKQDQANVRISGMVTVSADVIEAKADLSPGITHGKAVDWSVIADSDTLDKGEFTGMISLKAGGWYIVSIRARRDKDVVAESRIMKVGVGDVFITAGQSNSANFGRPRQEAKDDRVVYRDTNTFIPAKDPIPGGCGGGGSIWPLLGDRIAGSQHVPVCFRSTSLTWTEVKNWMPPDTGLYKNLVTCVGAFDRNGIRAVLWHQGESDSLAKTPAQTYCERLQTIIESLNKDAGYDIPWFVAQASFHPGSQETEEKEVAKGQRLLWEKEIAHKGAVTDDLGQEYRSDGVHFNEVGLKTHAERWFKALAAAYEWDVDPSRNGIKDNSQ